ncbi:Alpha beta hydrolase [Cyanidiococcus yangmingshanensis]|uniref:Alpha beta hydrolase n=1 Tax=Cyanidiococcus yangmingshanensis TaxID=2690220 RepID=A0A7J7IGH5_9RHOD|nr:Alpha beta hydrolase [Cyanidiococcus yangmingshanensis]
MICIHGFGAGAFHWQKMMTRISRAGCDVFALDLLGFGDADMPLPSDGSSLQPYSFQYTFENWSEQILHFMKEVLPSETKRKHARKRDVVLVANSIGCVVALQTAYSAFVRYANREVDDAFSIRGVMCLNPSLRQLHFRKRRGFSRWTTPLSLRVLRFRPLARVFFDWVRRPETLRRLLSSAYAVSGAEAAEVVTSDLVERIRAPSMRAGALEVFLAFTSYDRGPLAEELVEQIREVAARERLKAPKVWVLWGERDPWESCTVGRALFANNPSVDRFVELKSLGHCPHDQDPDTVMRYLHEFVASLESYVGRTRDVQPEPFDIDADSP